MPGAVLPIGRQLRRNCAVGQLGAWGQQSQTTNMRQTTAFMCRTRRTVGVSCGSSLCRSILKKVSNAVFFFHCGKCYPEAKKPLHSSYSSLLREQIAWHFGLSRRTNRRQFTTMAMYN